MQTHRPAVGSIVPWVQAGIGAVATQAQSNVDFGPQALAHLESGLGADAALRAIIAADDEPAIRQVAIVDALGNIAAHTGRNCIPHHGSVRGEGYSAQANMMLHGGVHEAMAAAFEKASGSLETRLMAALVAAQVSGGDIRGMQSGAILVRRKSRLTEGSNLNARIGTDVDLRVDNDLDPLARLRELLDIRAAESVVHSPEAAKSLDAAREAFKNASRLAPSDELTFWYAVTTLSSKLEANEEAAKILRPLFRREPRWAELFDRLPEIPADSPLRKLLLGSGSPSK